MASSTPSFPAESTSSPSPLTSTSIPVATTTTELPTASTNTEATQTSSAAEPQPVATPTPALASTTAMDAQAAPPEPSPVAVEGQPAAASTPTSTTKEEHPQETQDTEPQNPLTERFTQAEWDALKAFRADLPETFAAGFPDDPKASEKPITFWGVTIDPKSPNKDARVSVILMKFLRARNLSISDANEMLVSTLRWRTSFKIDEVLEEKFPEDVFSNVGHVYGRDKEGRPVVYNLYGGSNIAEVFSDTARFIRWRVALQEKSISSLDFTNVDQTLQIHDYLGVSLTSRDAKSKAAATEATNIFQSHYPELLYKKFFVNVPTLMNWIFWAFRPLLPAATLAKMSVVGSGHHALKKALLPYIRTEELPEQYGGEAEGW